MATSKRRSALLYILLCALASTAIYTAFPVSVSPWTHSLSRMLLAATGLDYPYILSRRDDAGAAAQPLTDGGQEKNPGIGGPIVTDLLTCGDPKLPPHPLPPLYCCPPMSASEPINFTLPDPAAVPFRTRLPAHAAGADMAKYERAVALMKALPRTDPRSFYQQANVHCAYCTGSYRQVGHPEFAVQIHFSWLFFPFHRAYLYFFERIAAKLLGDPGFALPFWSWDVPEGMRMPPEFENTTSPLYDPVRRHSTDQLVDVGFRISNKSYTDEEQIVHNLRVMYKQMVSNGASPSLFMGQPFRAGEPDFPGAGTVELYPHNSVHLWAGDMSRPNFENMGVYYSAGRDPIFYPHHANIDRLWEAWRDVSGRCHPEFTDPDWLDSSFLLYDEEARLVRITVRDVLDLDKLRYTYDGVGMPWLATRPPTTPNVNTRKGPYVGFPVSLDTAVTAEVRRPQGLRTRQEKETHEEVLVIEGIETNGTVTVKFDVFVNAREYEKVEPSGREMVGSFVCLKHLGMGGGGMEGKGIVTSMRLALNEVLEDLGGEKEESVTVTLVPRRGKVRIKGVRIEYTRRYSVPLAHPL